MKRHIWITAAQLVEDHGCDDAVDVIYTRLGKLLGEADGVSDELQCWCEIGEAVLAIVREVEEDETVH
jgi:hypothetical protein